MNKMIGNRAARAFAAAFYSSLAYGCSIRTAFDLAKTDVALQGIGYPGEPDLLSREGCNPSAVYLVNPKTRRARKGTEYNLISPSDIEATLEKIISGTSDLKVRQLIQNAVTSGHLIFTNEEPSQLSESGRHQPIIKSYRNQLNVEIDQANYELLQKNLFPRPSGIAPPFPALIFIGREAALRDVKEMVIGTGKETQRGSMTIIRGWPGVGKTTLVGVLGRDVDTQDAFADGVLWTSLGQKPNLLLELAKWGRALGTNELLRTPTLDDATAQLRLLLERKRMLLIVDDVWDAGHATPFIEAYGQSNALLITTRETSNVAEALEVFHPTVYLLPVLTEEDALKLLRVLAPQVVEQHTDQCLELVKALECLPLALHVAGSLLKREAKLGWGVEGLLEDIKKGAAILEAQAPADRIEEGERPTVKALLQKSTDLLDDFTRDCFAFLAPFAPKPATFDLAAMKAAWKVNDPKPTVRKLVGHGLLEPVGDGRFQMHALLLSHAYSLLTE